MGEGKRKGGEKREWGRRKGEKRERGEEKGGEKRGWGRRKGRKEGCGEIQV